MHWQNILFVISKGKLTLGLVWWIDLKINPPIYKSVQKTSIMNTDLIFSRPYQYFKFSLNFSKFSAATQPQDYLICKLLMGCWVLQPTCPLEGLIKKVWFLAMIFGLKKEVWSGCGEQCCCCASLQLVSTLSWSPPRLPGRRRCWACSMWSPSPTLRVAPATDTMAPATPPQSAPPRWKGS